MGMPEFHIARMASMHLAEEQKRPDEKDFKSQSMFVISRIDVLSKLKNPYLIEQHEK